MPLWLASCELRSIILSRTWFIDSVMVHRVHPGGASDLFSQDLFYVICVGKVVT